MSTTSFPGLTRSERVSGHSNQVEHGEKGVVRQASVACQGGVAQEFRCPEGDKHEYCSETPDLAMVKAVIAHAATVGWAR